MIPVDRLQVEQRNWIGRVPRARAWRGRENLLVNFQRRARCENHRALQDVFQLAHIARPVVRAQPRHCLLANRVDLPANARGELCHKELNQQRQIIRALPQRWQGDREDV